MKHPPRDEAGDPILPSYRGELLVRFSVEANGGDDLQERTDELFAALLEVAGVTYVEWFSETEEVAE